MYNRNAPFAAEKWFLAGTMEQSVLLAFSDRVREVLPLPYCSRWC